ncbi:hypothetical protein BaRGS_00004688 [Batillaria attramentaria]|uniref:Uncharacterized protein n=1 Tax=Batillaria attramentaria TaxID=370345 RepID=A0ABD0LXV4_9CAEN
MWKRRHKMTSLGDTGSACVLAECPHTVACGEPAATDKRVVGRDDHSNALIIGVVLMNLRRQGSEALIRVAGLC